MTYSINNTKQNFIKRFKVELLNSSDPLLIITKTPLEAENLKKRLHKEGNIDNLSIIKLSKNKFRLTCGPFKNFSSLKNTYTSLNTLGFVELNIYKK